MNCNHLNGFTAGQILAMDWYERTVEPEIRSVVRILRDNGFNTTGSCGHEMWVVVLIGNPADVGEIYGCLHSHGHRKVFIEVGAIEAAQFIGLAKISFKPEPVICNIKQT